MKKLLLACGAMALLSMAGAAWADEEDPVEEPVPVWTVGQPDVDLTTAETDGAGVTFLFATAQLDKDVTTNELINVTTLVNLDQLVDDTHATGFAEASAMAKQTSTDNHSNGSEANRADSLANSGMGNAGLLSINQASGDNNNQGTLVSTAIGSGTATEPGFAHAQAEATQTNGAAIIGIPLGERTAFLLTPGNDVEAVDVAFRTASIADSLNGDVGLIYANQSSGNNNNQLNVLTLAFSERPQGVAIAEADLGQFNTLNKVGESDGITSDDSQTAVRIDQVGVNKSASMVSSLNGNLGVFGVNQSVGNNGNAANVVSLAAIGSNLPGF